MNRSSGWALRRTKQTDEVIGRILERLDRGRPGSGRVRCPQCHWQPGASDRWYCGRSADPPEYHRGCGTSWNTFVTQGRCPGCQHLWTWTACLACGAWSRHERWYVHGDD